MSVSLTGEVAFRAQNLRSPAGLPSFKKAFFDLQVGLMQNGTFVHLWTEADWALHESTQGELYAMAPSAPMYDRKNGGILQDADGKDRYKTYVFFTRESEEPGAKLTEASFAIKNAINAAAVSAYKSGAAVANGVGSRARPTRATAPAGAARATAGEERGLPGGDEFPGALQDEDDLPFA